LSKRRLRKGGGVRKGSPTKEKGIKKTGKEWECLCIRSWEEETPRQAGKRRRITTAINWTKVKQSRPAKGWPVSKGENLETGERWGGIKGGCKTIKRERTKGGRR